MQEMLPGFDEIEAVVEGDGISPEEARRISEESRRAFERRGGVDWMEEYTALRAEGWTWRVACYISWAMTPRKGRWPKSMQELASVLGLRSARTIRAWREKNAAIDERVKGAIVAPLMEARADIIEALVESATSPDYKHHRDRRLALEMAKLYTPRQEVDATVKQAGVFLPELEPLEDDGEIHEALHQEVQDEEH
jgi:hypothetical protein